VANPTLDLLETVSFPKLALALRDRAEAIVFAWEQAVVQILPSADQMTAAQVRDHIPEIIETLAIALESNEPAAVDDLRQDSRSHGAVRFHQHYNPRELIIEYRLLRRVIMEEVYQAAQGRLSLNDIVVLDMGVDTAMQQGLLALIQHQHEQIQSATESESKYLRFLSHDLRNNLNQVVLVLELLRGRLEGVNGFGQDVNDIQSAHRTIMNTITGMDALLQAERLRKGMVHAKAEPVALPDLAAEVGHQFLSQARQKGLEVTWQCPAGATVRSDQDLILVVLQNLVGNAVKYSDKGMVQIIVERWTRDGKQGWTIAVTDQGPGIGAEDRQRIFEAFARGQTHGQAGVGLGLAIASAAAKLLNARLSVESQVGSGSTFRLEFPAD
jgi:signal transduction histidine kinase